jgi:hypothetical protein
VGDQLSLRVAGGFDPDRLRVCLEIEDHDPHCTSGFESLAFGRRLWNIARFRGEMARLTIVDESSARNGVILVDEVQQWASREPAAPLRDPPGADPPGGNPPR